MRKNAENKARYTGIILTAAMAAAAFAGIVLTGYAVAGRERMQEAGADRPEILYLANNLPEDSCTTKALDWFAGQVKERTDGRVEIRLYNDGELGDSVDCLEQLQYGGIDLVKTDVSALSNYVDVFQILAMPYIYQNQEHFEQVHGGRIGMELLHGEDIKARNMYGLTFYDGGSRCFYNSSREIHCPKDLEGMMVRVQPASLMMNMVERMGGHSIALPYQEVSAALQPGGVDAAENSIVNYVEQGHYQTAPYFVEDEHIRQADVLVMGEHLRDRLSPEEIEIMEETALDSWQYQKQLWAEAETAARRTLQNSGVKITALSEEEYQEFLELCMPMWYAYRDGAYNQLVDQIVACGMIQHMADEKSVQKDYMAVNGD